MTLEGKGMSKNKYENVPAQQDNPDDDFETRYLIQLLREETIWEKRRRASHAQAPTTAPRQQRRI
jgi:hypothetical protein